MKLNIGAGPVKYENELGVDLYRTSACELQADTKYLPFEDNSIEFIRYDHCLEHQSLKDSVPVMFELYRVLKPDSILKVGVPDFEATCKQYLEQKTLENKFYVLSVVYGGQAHAGEYHKSGWDYNTLENLLKSVGFQDIVITKDDTRDKGECITANARK